jgi:serine/threonine protein kinase
LTADAWRRVCTVLDRVHDTSPELRDAILETACREHGLSIDDVKPFVDATEASAALPEEIPLELIENAFGDIAPEAADVRLNAGQKLGPFEIVAFLGAGGMGEVYRATDTRLDRTVAIKVLRPHLLQSEDARRRFDQEARAISKLTHPHVCTLYDVGHQDGVDFLVMEHVEGETLAERLQRGAIPIAQATRLGSQIADALDRAHRQGIVHRDLKPANIMLTRSGVRLLDFGLARLDVAAEADERALIGTPQYMSPEQLQRRPADSRSDIFACGAVLYEMVTGQRAFGGSSQASVIAAIVERDPVPVAQRVPAVPAALDWTIARCLAKDPEDRWQSAADLKHHLDWIATSTEPARGPTRRARTTLWISASTITAVAFLGTWAWRANNANTPPAAPFVFTFEPPAGTTFALTHAVSPDGRRIAFTTTGTGSPRELWIRSLDSLSAQPIAGSEGATFPFWSPDGRFVGFFAAQKLKKVELATGNIQIVCDIGAVDGGAWNQHDVILFSSDSGTDRRLWLVSASGGTPMPIAAAVDPRDGWPQFLPDGRRFIHMSTGRSEPGIYAGRLDSAEVRDFVMRFPPATPDTAARRVTRAVLAGDVVFFLDQTTLMAQRFDTTRMSPIGEPVRVAENVEPGVPGEAAFDASPTGTVTYRQSAPARLAQLTWLDRGGRPIGHVGEPGPIITIWISPDQRFALVEQWGARDTPSSGTASRIDLETGAATRLFANAAAPIWSPDGSRIAFTQFLAEPGPTVTVAAVDGNSPPRRILERLRTQATDWSNDGRFIVGAVLTPDTSWNIWIADADGGGYRELSREPFQQREGRISPDGQWVAYASNDAQGVWEVYVRSLPDGGRLRRISTRGGRSPRWRSDGRELYYVAPGGRVMRVPIATAPTFSPGAPELLFQHAGLTGAPEGATFGYDVTPDGSRFLVAVPTADAIPPAPLVVILNWTFPDR